MKLWFFGCNIRGYHESYTIIKRGFPHSHGGTDVRWSLVPFFPYTPVMGLNPTLILCIYIYIYTHTHSYEVILDRISWNFKRKPTKLEICLVQILSTPGWFYILIRWTHMLLLAKSHTAIGGTNDPSSACFSWATGADASSGCCGSASSIQDIC